MGLPGRKDQGFTLIEIMIAVTIGLLIMAVAVPTARNYLRQAKVGTTKQQLQTIRFAIEQFQMDTSVLPGRLRDLIKRPTGDDRVAGRWSGPYLPGKEEPRDAWNVRFVYRPTEDAKHPFELYSYGADGKGSPKSDHISIWQLD